MNVPSDTGQDGTAIQNDRQTEVDKLYFEQYPEIAAAVYDRCPTLIVFDHERTMDALRVMLTSYTGPLYPETFTAWAINVASHEAERYVSTAALIREHSAVIYSAIHNTMRGASLDCSVDHEDMFCEVAALIFANVHSLVRPGKAKLSTRLYSLARRHVLSYHTVKRNRRHSLLTKHLRKGGEVHCEVVSPEEIDSQRSADGSLALLTT